MAEVRDPEQPSYHDISTGALDSLGESISSATCLADNDCKGLEYRPSDTNDDCDFFPLEVDFTDLVPDSETVIIKECGKCINYGANIFSILIHG